MHHKVTSLSVIIQMELPEIPFSGEFCGFNPQRLYNELSRSKFEDKVSLTNHICVNKEMHMRSQTMFVTKHVL
jgi:hypothetical protein